MKMETCKIAQRYAIFFFLFISRHLGTLQCQEHKPFRWRKMFSEDRTLVEDEQRSG
jgi:hypothetical protein